MTGDELQVHVHEPARGGGRAGPTAATLLLLHGLTDSGASWADAVGRWTASGRRVVTADARGHGGSPRWDAERLAARPGAVMVRDVQHLLGDARLGPPGAPVLLVGHSMGAAVAVGAAAGATARPVAGVVAEDPPWSLPPATGPSPARARMFLRGHREDAALGVAQLRERGRAEHPSWPATELDPWARAKHACDPALLATGDIVPPGPWPELLRGCVAAGTPVLVVTGDADVRVGEAVAAEARRCGALVVRLPGAGHCVRRDAGAAYHAVVDAFLAAPG